MPITTGTIALALNRVGAPATHRALDQAPWRARRPPTRAISQNNGGDVGSDTNGAPRDANA